MNLLFLMLVALFETTPLSVKSPAFTHNGDIPLKYTCEGENINPELHITKLPEQTESLAIIMDDPDAAGGTFVHWVMWNIPPRPNTIAENTHSGAEGANGKMENRYTGPCPPSGYHRYYFRVYALDIMLDIPPGSDKQQLLVAMQGHILAEGELIGLYKKQSSK
jgi:Raf kinase inhibitor-like YbhB/YbcL family protein